jgi:hypothetical protein
MTPDISTDPEELEVSSAQIPSLDRAGSPHIFRGIALEPLSVRRQLAAQALGNKLLSGRVKLDEGGAYDGMFADVAVMLFLCSQPVSVAHRAIRRPDDVHQEALEWAEKEGISIGSKDFVAACNVYADILRELQDAQFEVVEHAGGTAPKNEPGGQATAA